LQPIACVPEVAAEIGLQSTVLPEFVTPDWLKDNHHLMRADLRKLASSMAEDYSDWPAAVDGSDDLAFWRAVHTVAQRWAGRRDRSQWQEHEAWLAGFESLPYRHAKRRTVVLGDFNQRVPRRSQPKGVHAVLLHAFEGFSLATAGDLEGAPGRALDHIAHTPDMEPAGGIGLWPRNDRRDRRLSDHFGVWGDFAFGTTGRRLARWA